MKRNNPHKNRPLTYIGTTMPDGINDVPPEDLRQLYSQNDAFRQFCEYQEHVNGQEFAFKHDMRRNDRIARLHSHENAVANAIKERKQRTAHYANDNCTTRGGR